MSEVDNPSDTDQADLRYLDPAELREHPANDEIYKSRELGEDFLDSIATNGVLEPIVVKAADEQTIISGHRRAEAARRAGLDAVSVRTVAFESEAEEIQALVDFNRQREKTPGEKTREAHYWLQAEKEKNRQKQREAGRRGGKASPSDDSDDKGSSHGTKPSTERIGNDSYEKAAETVGVGSTSLKRGVSVLEAAEGEDDDEDVQEVAEQEMAKLDDGEQSFRGAKENLDATHELRELAECGDTIEQEVAQETLADVKADAIEAREALEDAKREIQTRRHQRLAEQAETADAEADPADSTDPIAQSFDVVVAEPNWQYASAGWRVAEDANDAYPELSLEDLAAMDAPAASDAVLWLWFPNPFVSEAVELARKWGFEHQDILTWDRERYGPRLWLRNRTKHCLFCTRGEPDVSLNDHPTLVRGPEAAHSHKPETFYEIVEDGCLGSKVELFATDAYSGADWTALGQELSTEKDLGADAPESDEAAQADFGTGETQVIHNKADLILSYPEGRFSYEDLEDEVLQGHIRELYHKNILVKTGERTVIDSEFADGRHEERTRYRVNEFRVADAAREEARQVVANRDLEMPCGHSGIQNHGDHYQCSNPICSREFDADTVEEVLG
jgi:N6-adenosine-specific RNA methylase IME4/general stress protein YciG